MTDDEGSCPGRNCKVRVQNSVKKHAECPSSEPKDEIV